MPTAAKSRQCGANQRTRSAREAEGMVSGIVRKCSEASSKILVLFFIWLMSPSSLRKHFCEIAAKSRKVPRNGAEELWHSLQ